MTTLIRFFNSLADGLQESGGRGAVDGLMVKGEAERDLVSCHDAIVLQYNRLTTDGSQ